MLNPIQNLLKYCKKKDNTWSCFNTSTRALSGTAKLHGRAILYGCLCVASGNRVGFYMCLCGYALVHANLVLLGLFIVARLALKTSEDLRSFLKSIPLVILSINISNFSFSC